MNQHLTSAVAVPAPIQSALSSHPTSSLSSLSSSPRVQTNPNRNNRDSVQRRQVWWLPYVVLEFDKNEVLVDALGGDLGSPVWMYSATGDVSRISEISVTTYLRTAQPSSAAGNGSGNGEGQMKAGGQGADMGNSDLCLGGIRFTPDLESMVSHHVSCLGSFLTVHPVPCAVSD
jgi:serum/glucocorticoid-regulated kinase 2